MVLHGVLSASLQLVHKPNVVQLQVCSWWSWLRALIFLRKKEYSLKVNMEEKLLEI